MDGGFPNGMRKATPDYYRLLLICFVLLSGCDSSSRGIKIVPVGLTTREKMLLSAAEIDNQDILHIKPQNVKLNKVHTWIDYYENGHFVGKMDTSQNTSGSFYWLAMSSPITPDSYDEKWIISCAGVSSTFTVTRLEPKYARSSGFSGPQLVAINRVINIGYIVDWKDHITSSDIFSSDKIKDLINNQKYTFFVASLNENLH